MGALGPGALCGGVRGGGSPSGKNAVNSLLMQRRHMFPRLFCVEALFTMLRERFFILGCDPGHKGGGGGPRGL